MVDPPDGGGGDDDGGDDGGDLRPLNRTWLPSAWAPMAAICVVIIILGSVALVIVLSLIVLYLPKKGSDLVKSNKNNVNTLGIQSANFVASTAAGTNGQKKKRQISGQVSCNTSQGDNLDMAINIKNCPAINCRVGNCIMKCAADIKSRIQSKFGSNPSVLNVGTTDAGVLSANAQFCSFGKVISGKKDKSKRISLNSDDTNVNMRIKTE